MQGHRRRRDELPGEPVALIHPRSSSAEGRGCPAFRRVVLAAIALAAVAACRVEAPPPAAPAPIGIRIESPGGKLLATVAAASPAALPIEGLARSFATAASRCAIAGTVALSFAVERGRIRGARAEGADRCFASALEGQDVAGEQVSLSVVHAQLGRE